MLIMGLGSGTGKKKKKKKKNPIKTEPAIKVKGA
jgi:hypothetical protein